MAKKSNNQQDFQKQENPEDDLVALLDETTDQPNLTNGETGFAPEYDPSFNPMSNPEQFEREAEMRQQGDPATTAQRNGFTLPDNQRWTGQTSNEHGEQNMQTLSDSTPKQTYGQQDMNFSQTNDWAGHSGNYGGRNHGSVWAQLLPMSDVKHWFSLLGGVYLAIYGLSRSLGSLTLVGAGVGLVYYAVTGQWPLAGRMGGAKTNQGGRNAAAGAGALNAIRSNTGEATSTKNIIVKAPLQEVYQAWANFENFPNFMRHIKSVSKTGDRTSHWVMEGPLNSKIEWDAETTRLEENKRIAWNSITGDIKTSGQVTFNALPDNEVEVTVMLKYVLPAGLAGEIAAELFSNPESKLLEDLRNFKHYIEAKQPQAA